MNLTRPNARHARIHEANAQSKPICGGGHGGKSFTAWQKDFSAVDCKLCAYQKRR